MRIAPMLLACAVALTAVPSLAQPADEGAAIMAAQREAIAKLAWMNGRWRGIAVTQGPQGEHRVTQTERIGDFLGATIKMVEGRGFMDDGRVGFNALGIVSYDPASRRYNFHSYAQGRSGDFAFVPGDNGYVWEIPAGPMTIRYTAKLAGGTWNEIGERIISGKPPVKFFEMNLKRIGDGDWPEAGAMEPK